MGEAWYYLTPMSFRIEHAHELGIDEARARIRALGDYLDNKHGIKVEWTGTNEAQVLGSFLVVKIEAKVMVEDKRVVFDGKDPGMLWRSKARSYLENKMQTYLDPKRTSDDLPRA